MKIKNILFILIGLIIGSVGIVIAEYTLKASDVEFTKDGQTTSVQKAIEDLYNKTKIIQPRVQTITIKDNVTNQNYEKQMILAPENDTLVGTVYFNPANLNEACYETNVNGNTLDKTGCMKWYVYDKSDTSYGLLLDHNIYWGDYASTIEEKNKLTSTEEGGSGWEVTPDLISGADLARITKKQGWNKTDDNTYYYVDTLTQTADANKEIRTSKYYWLFDYTQGCISWGCRIADETGSEEQQHLGYYTSDCFDDSCTNIWDIGYKGRVHGTLASDDTDGLRPVVIISK